jgi:hypothetical protein
MRFHVLAVSAIIWLLFAETGFAQTFTGNSNNTITKGDR